MAYELISVYGLTTLLIKAGIILIISYSFYEQFELSPAYTRHNIWLYSLISLALLPLLSSLLPAIEWSILSVNNPPVVSEASNISIFSSQKLIGLYLLVLAVKLLRLSYEVLRIAIVSSRGVDVSAHYQSFTTQLSSKKATIKTSAEIDSPLTWGCINPVILLPERAIHWSQQEITMVLMHELAHITRRDWLSQLLGQLVGILYWPIPGIQSVLTRMSLEAERSADDEVLRIGTAASDYAGLLVKQARITQLQASVALGKPSELNLRVNHIISRYIDRSHVNTLRKIIIALCWLSLMPLAAIKVTAKIHDDNWHYRSLQITKIIPPSNQADAADTDVVNKKPVRPVVISTPPEFIEHSVSTNIDITVNTVNPAKINSDTTLTKRPLNSNKLTLLKNGLAKYPPRALAKNLEGYALVEYDINTQGQAINGRVIRSSHRVFNKAALSAISQYLYTPVQVNNVATEVLGIQEKFVFKLSSSKPDALTSNPRASPN